MQQSPQIEDAPIHDIFTGGNNENQSSLSSNISIREELPRERMVETTLRVPGAPRRVTFGAAEPINSNRASSSREVENERPSFPAEDISSPFGRSHTIRTHESATNYFFDKTPP